MNCSEAKIDESKNVRRLINFATIVVVILLAAVAIYWYDLGILSNINALQAYIARLGIAGALFLCSFKSFRLSSDHSWRCQYGSWRDFVWPMDRLFITTSVLQLARLSISILLGDLVSRCLLI